MASQHHVDRTTTCQTTKQIRALYFQLRKGSPLSHPQYHYHIATHLLYVLTSQPLRSLEDLSNSGLRLETQEVEGEI